MVNAEDLAIVEDLVNGGRRRRNRMIDALKPKVITVKRMK